MKNKKCKIPTQYKDINHEIEKRNFNNASINYVDRSLPLLGNDKLLKCYENLCKNYFYFQTKSTSTLSSTKKAFLRASTPPGIFMQGISTGILKDTNEAAISNFFKKVSIGHFATTPVSYTQKLWLHSRRKENRKGKSLGALLLLDSINCLPDFQSSPNNSINLSTRLTFNIFDATATPLQGTICTSNIFCANRRFVTICNDVTAHDVSLKRGIPSMYKYVGDARYEKLKKKFGKSSYLYWFETNKFPPKKLFPQFLLFFDSRVKFLKGKSTKVQALNKNSKALVQIPDLQSLSVTIPSSFISPLFFQNNSLPFIQLKSSAIGVAITSKMLKELCRHVYLSQKEVKGFTNLLPLWGSQNPLTSFVPIKDLQNLKGYAKQSFAQMPLQLSDRVPSLPALQPLTPLPSFGGYGVQRVANQRFAQYKNMEAVDKKTACFTLCRTSSPEIRDLSSPLKFSWESSLPLLVESDLITFNANYTPNDKMGYFHIGHRPLLPIGGLFLRLPSISIFQQRGLLPLLETSQASAITLLPMLIYAYLLPKIGSRIIVPAVQLFTAVPSKMLKNFAVKKCNTTSANLSTSLITQRFANPITFKGVQNLLPLRSAQNPLTSFVPIKDLQNLKGYAKQSFAQMTLQPPDRVPFVTNLSIFQKGVAKLRFAQPPKGNSLRLQNKALHKKLVNNNANVFPGQLVSYGTTITTSIPCANLSTSLITQRFANPLGSTSLITQRFANPMTSKGYKEGQKGTVTTESGQVLYLDSQKITIRKAQTVLIYSQAIIAVLSGEWIKKGTPLMSLSYQKLVTGDIVQGLPKIEQFFEAPVLREGTFWSDSLQAKLNQFFQEEREKLPLAEAVRKSFSEIQRVLVEGVQRVYISQGVLIADKHLEVIVRQMTCKGRILYSGDTGFLRNELVSLDKIENVNQVTYGQKALYHPQVRGITDASLESESFLSAASFQETTRVLSRDAIIGKTDLMRGLKERVIVGELIQAGTGLANNNVYNLL